MYSLLFISLVKPIYKKYCEEHRTSDKVQKIFKIVLPKLSDTTRVATQPWRTLKVEAMKDDYQQQTWFKTLNPESKKKLEELRAAQDKQGN